MKENEYDTQRNTENVGSDQFGYRKKAIERCIRQNKNIFKRSEKLGSFGRTYRVGKQLSVYDSLLYKRKQRSTTT